MTDNAGPAQIAYRAARVLAEVFAPAVCVAVVCLAIGGATASAPAAGLLWGLVAAVFCAGLPLWFMARGARRGDWTSHHVRERSARMLPLAVAIGSVVVGLGLLVLGGAPGELVAAVVAMLVYLVLATAITKVWKISLHAAIAAGSVVLIAITFSAWWLLATLIVAAVGWSRIHTDDHTRAQVVAGALLGAIVGGGCYSVGLSFVGDDGASEVSSALARVH